MHKPCCDLLNALIQLPPRHWTDQEHRLGAHAGLVGDAVAAHCAIGDITGAVEIAELGRGILLGAALSGRTDLSELEHAHPDLAAGFRHVRTQLDTPAGDPDGHSSWVDHRKRLWAEHDDLLAQIRRHSGFARFLRPPRLADLRPAMTDGPVLLVNAGQRGGHAIILTVAAEPVLVALPELTSTAVLSQAIALLEATHSDGLAGTLRKHRVLPEILSWLWDTTAGPILDALSSRVDGELPRVWWLPRLGCRRQRRHRPGTEDCP